MKKNNPKISPEVFFIKYAYPCAFIIKQRQEINDDELEELRVSAVEEKPLAREKLEKIFFRAFERIVILAKEMKKDKWDIDVLRAYFITRHNEIIEEGMYSYAKAPESLRNLCKVHKAKVIEKKDDVLVVEYDNGKTRPVMNELTPTAKVGDFVTIHYGYAVEKV
jgi:hydrogenase maturation factor